MSAAAEKMRREGLPDIAIETFAHYERRLREGETGTLPEAEIEPLGELPDATELPPGGEEALDRVVVLKLNGGLGTSMGMTKAKSLLEVKDGRSFLDIIVRQVLHLRDRTGARIPLLLMNSFATREDSMAALARYPELEVDVPLDFVQGKVPKLLADGFEPVEWPHNPALEWAPPGHGDVYTSLATSGVLGELLDRGYEYLFLSNADNLGAVLEPRILGWFAGQGLPFLSEVTDRTEGDKKGGHLARRRDGGGGLVLRETAQTPDEDMEAFQDTTRHRFFNCNTIWLDLHALRRTLDERDGVLGLPMIVNRKTVDATDPSSPEVIQLETAMGAAIDVFEGAAALHVPRSRFVPVKTTNELLALRSDAYELADDWAVRLVPVREGRPPLVELDSEYFKLLPDFEARFAAGPPSLARCDRLSVKGDVSFGRDVVVRGSVTVEGPRRIEDEAVLEG